MNHDLMMLFTFLVFAPWHLLCFMGCGVDVRLHLFSSYSRWLFVPVDWAALVAAAGNSTVVTTTATTTTATTMTTMTIMTATALLQLHLILRHICTRATCAKDPEQQ